MCIRIENKYDKKREIQIQRYVERSDHFHCRKTKKCREMSHPAKNPDGENDHSAKTKFSTLSRLNLPVLSVE